MYTSKFILSLTLSFTLFANSLAYAAVSGNPKDALQLVDEYLQMRSAKPAEGQTPKEALFNALGKEDYITQAVAMQLLSLEPEDFNLFLLYFMDRYVNKPSERLVLFDFLKILRGMIENDLANTELVKEGPEHYLVEGSYSYLMWIVVGGAIGWRTIMASPLRNSAFLREVGARDAALIRSSRVYRYSTKIMRNSLIGASVGGVGIGYLDYLLQSHRTHRLDPAEILMVVQANLACQLSYDALKLNERVEAAVNDEKTVVQLAPALKLELTATIENAQVLLKEFPRLTKLDVNDRLFAKTLSFVPPAKDWQQYKKLLNESEANQDGQCRQISMEFVTRALSTASDNLTTIADAYAPPTPAPVAAPAAPTTPTPPTPNAAQPPAKKTPTSPKPPVTRAAPKVEKPR